MGEIRKRRPLVNGKRKSLRVMSDAEVLEREELNQQNTATQLRNKVLQALNGRGSGL